jgi:superfamily II DNA or RNA helicase
MIVEKVNESYSIIYGGTSSINGIRNFLRVENPRYLFSKSPWIEKYIGFTKVLGVNKILVYSGHLGILKNFGVEYTDDKPNISESEVDEYLKSVKLPFQPYDYQINNIKLALTNYKMLFRSCTSSGKSLSISLILNFFRLKGLRGVLIVPNINLLTQFKNDIISYGLDDLANQTLLLGDGHTSDFSTCLTITTWQSMTKEVGNLDKLKLDFMICDEAHRMASECTSDIILKSTGTKIKLGFTGTLPEDAAAKMTLIGLFGLPKTIITSSELIDRGLATPVYIKSLILNYNHEDKRKFRTIESYSEQLKFIKEHEQRSSTITKIIRNCYNNGKNTLVLFQHTDHGKDIFRRIVKDIYNIDVSDSDIVGKNSLEFQKKHKILFMNGEQNSSIREQQRNFMEQTEGTILIGNFAIMGTGINIKRLYFLVFASPLKAFTTISQSLGRLMRKHKDKSKSVVIDIVDNFGLRKPGGVFYKQYKHRLTSSYIPEEFSVAETTVDFL